MITGTFWEGSGLGNQLFRYIATRVLAEDKGYEWYMGDPYLFKGRDFMKIAISSGPSKYFNDMYPLNIWQEKKVVENGIDIRGYDPEFNFIEDDTTIDGEFQDPRYFEHRLDDIKNWLRVDYIKSPDDVCLIGFRGGEYSVFPDLFLTKDYWDEGIRRMKEINPDMKFEVHTDDPVLAQKFFPDYKVIHNVGVNWRSMRFAKHAIIANSSFYIIPRLLSKGITIAPRFWARRNIKVWALPSNFYKSFLYI